MGRRIGCWCASQRQPASAAEAELDYATAASFAYPALHKGAHGMFLPAGAALAVGPAGAGLDV
jgi:hypothetical protein